MTTQGEWFTIKEPLNRNEQKLFDRILVLVDSTDEKEIPPMRNVDKKRLMETSKKVDSVLKKISLDNITTLNNVIYVLCRTTYLRVAWDQT